MWGKKKDHRLKRQLSETNQNKQRLSQLDSGDKARIVEIGTIQNQIDRNGSIG